MTVTVLTMRTKNSAPTPQELGGCTTSHCDQCGEEVWLSFTSTEALAKHPDHEVICQVCAAPMLAKEGMDAEMRSADPRFSSMLRNNKPELVAWMIEQGLQDS